MFVCFSTPKVGDYFVFKSHKWVRFSWVFFFFFVFVFVFVLFCVVFPSKCSIPHHISRVRLIFFLSRRLVKFFAFFYFCLFVFILFCFVLFCILFCFQQFHPPWYQMVRPYPYSITQIMVDITSSTILNSRAIQWKM